MLNHMSNQDIFFLGVRMVKEGEGGLGCPKNMIFWIFMLIKPIENIMFLGGHAMQHLLLSVGNLQVIEACSSHSV